MKQPQEPQGKATAIRRDTIIRTGAVRILVNSVHDDMASIHIAYDDTILGRGRVPLGTLGELAQSSPSSAIRALEQLYRTTGGMVFSETATVAEKNALVDARNVAYGIIREAASG